MSNESIQIPGVNFQPWVGKHYGKRSNRFDPVRLLVLGESLYEDSLDENGEDPHWITIKNSYGEQAFTRYVVNRWGKQRPHRFFTMVANVLLQRMQGGSRTQQHIEIWDHVAFYNYESTYAYWELGKDGPNNPDDEKRIESNVPFEYVLKSLKPNAILTIGADLSYWFFCNHNHQTSSKLNEPYEDRKISFLRISHPRNWWNFRYERVIPGFEALLYHAKQLIKNQSSSNSKEYFVHASSVDTVIQVYEECCEQNWDGYGSLAISPAVLFEAIRFICALPQRLPSPQIVPEPAGDIVFEWNNGSDWTFVASVSGKRFITYTGLFGIGVKTQGTEVFDGSIPQILIEQISRVSQVS